LNYLNGLNGLMAKQNEVINYLILTEVGERRRAMAEPGSAREGREVVLNMSQPT